MVIESKELSPVYRVVIGAMREVVYDLFWPAYALGYFLPTERRGLISEIVEDARRGWKPALVHRAWLKIVPEKGMAQEAINKYLEGRE